MEKRTEWRGGNESQIVEEEKCQTCWCCRDQQRACRMAQASAEKLEHTGRTRRSGNEASERRKGIGEDERQPVVARLADRWRRSNLVTLVML